MKPYLERVVPENERSLIVKHLVMPYFDAPFHFHPEYELTYILRGYGQRFVGETTERFEANDFVLIGPNLPHFWRSDTDFYCDNQEQICEAFVIQFSQKLVEQLLLPFPEFIALQGVLAQAEKGLVFENCVKNSTLFISILQDLCNASPGRQMIIFLQLLQELSVSPPPRLLLTGLEYNYTARETEAQRMGRILDYTIQNFQHTISLADIAGVAHLSEAAFCRYFRQRTRKTYTAYINELRVNHARQLLISSDLSVSQVALEAGFQNLSYFHRIFRKATGNSPLQFRSLYRA